ncbi:golgin subfamily A member 4-like isoform X4 [Plodia interpunctella]|uniref:golgin subfamily A member 4-like isoform X4 n=1 Tax=Plodia interpunctella TaxID=58824 RepID=UPI002368D79E|nr:golgin subfamily A member 4-like isoform X4 [Plodia interpunctella]
MDDPHKVTPETADAKNVLPDVVHSQQIPALGSVACDDNQTLENIPVDNSQVNSLNHDVGDTETESISEHIPSRVDSSVTDSLNTTTSHESQGILKVETEQEKESGNDLNAVFPHSLTSENPSIQEPSRQSTSWPLDVNAISDMHLISEESPVNLALSSDISKDIETHESKSQSLLASQISPKQSPEESPRDDNYDDSLNDELNLKNTDTENSLEKFNNALEQNAESLEGQSSGSEEIIKLDIRGSGAPKFHLPTAKIIFGPPPEGSTVIGANIEPIPVFPKLLSPFLVGTGDSVKVEEIFDFGEQQSKEPSPEKSLESSTSDKSLSSDKIEQNDLLVEEIVVDDDAKEKETVKDPSLTPQKSLAPDDVSLSTLTTDYKTICEAYHEKLVHFEDAITQRDELIEDLTVSLQRSVRERDEFKLENEHLVNEVQNLQHILGEMSQSDHDTVKGQLSDFMKYQTMVKDDSTKFYSALMSGGSSLQSSNGEKDMDHEEITVNYSKSDLKSSGSSEDFQTGFESKLTLVMNKFDEYIEENLRNKLRESVIQVLCDEIGKIRLESDTEIKELEAQIQQDKQAYSVETRRLRELLASVKAGNTDIDVLREELAVKHEKEMENLRTYFEKKCSDMERSYSEEVWRGRACASPSLEAPDAGGDWRRRARSADLPSLSLESTPLEQALKQTCKKYEQQIEDLKVEHLAYVNDLQRRHQETIASLEEQITQLKAHIQTSENSDGNVIYQQDIDLELEKVLLSDPDAEVSSWPVELVALRDKIHGDARQEKELSSLRDELSEDKWKQRRNLSFDQNRHLEEVTKERDGLKRVALSLHRVVGQLVAYCACAEDELNRTVVAQLLRRLASDADQTFCSEDSRPTTPSGLDLNLSTSLVSREKHVHFAPDLNSILAELDDEGVVGFLQEQRDLSLDIKQELEISLKRLRVEAQELLELSSRLNRTRSESKMIDATPVQITELVHEYDMKSHCDNCELHRKTMEEAMAECLQRENLLRSDLEAAMMKIAQLMTNERANSTDIIAEGYGTGSTQPTAGRVRLSATSPARTSSSDTTQHDVDTLLLERDDLLQQIKRMTDSPVHKICCEKLEAANRQLRSTRQFVEEQAAEREAERDDAVRSLALLRADNLRLSARLQANHDILAEMHRLRTPCDCRTHHAYVEQLETQTREMNQIINELEARKASADEELKATEEKITLLRDIIANLENQLEAKTNHETEILAQLEEMRKTIDDRDSKMRAVLGELESLKSEQINNSEVTCVKCGQEEDKYAELVEKIKEQCACIEDRIHRRTLQLQRSHEVCSAACSEPSEDVSLRDQKKLTKETEPSSPVASSPSPRSPALPELCGVWECLQAQWRAEDAALKRIADLEMQRAQLNNVAQEVRAERDVLQARMSEQALKISSLSARLQQQRNDAEALAHHAASQLCVQLHDANAEIQRMKEELESKEKQLTRVKLNLEERDKLNEQHHTLYGNSCNPKDKVIILERELSSAQSRIAQLESLARSLETDKEELQAQVRDQRRELAEKEEQLQELLALKLDDDHQRDEKSEIIEGKTSARTLSDIVSISEFDEQDLQMRRAELKAQNMSITGAPFVTDVKEKSQLNRTLPPELTRANMSSLNVEADHYDVQHTPRADSLPANLTSTQNKDIIKQYKRNVNETTMFGTIDKFGDSMKHSTAQKIPDNCSMYPNRDVSESKDISVQPKKIDFSIEASNDNRTHEEEEFTSLRELGIILDIKQENFPDILTQLKHEIKKSRSELENCKSELKNAEEQLCEFPALKEEVEELKGLLENTMATMENDKKFYENQLDNFSSNKKLLEQRVAELSQEVNDKSKDLHLLKEDILRRENMILELAKEKRNLTNKLTELEVKIDEVKSRNSSLEKSESENHQLREKVNELNKLEQLVSEKNQQIDSLNQHLDRFDNLQRCLNDKTEEFENLKEAFEEKSNELFQLQDTVDALTRDLNEAKEENNNLITNNNELKLKLTKLEKEQENASIKLHNSESELERLNSLNKELTTKIDELKLLTDKLKDKETEIEILNEDINSFHEEVATLKEQLKMVSRSPSPRNKQDSEGRKEKDASSDKKQLVKIRKQITLLQHELDFNKKELNDKAFELAKAKLDVTELKNNLGLANKQVVEKETNNNELKQRNETLRQEVEKLTAEKQQVNDQLRLLSARMREETNVSELRAKLQEKVERCQELEAELQDMKDLIERMGARDGRSPTAELERALRDQLHYSHALDEDIMDQILSASSDEREDIPRLALNTSKSSSSIHSSSSERLGRMRAENEKLQLQVNNLEARLLDKDALITELNRIRDKLVADSQTSKLRYEAERDNSARLQLLLDTHKDTADSLQHQDSNMIQILKKRLESSMQSELELQQKEQQLRGRVAQLERQLLADTDLSARQLLQDQVDMNSRLEGELTVAKSKLELERARGAEQRSALERRALRARRDRDLAHARCAALQADLADTKRQKHDTSLELLRTKELLSTKTSNIEELERKLTKLTAGDNKRGHIADALTEIEAHKSELTREIASLKKCLLENNGPEVQTLRSEKLQLTEQLQLLASQLPQPDEKEHAIRYLHGRCLRLESCRKALVWQKRYLQRVVAGYAELERTLRLPTRTERSSGKKRFKCVATVVTIVLRMEFLVRRRVRARALAAGAVLRARNHTPMSQFQSRSPPSRECPAAPTPAPTANVARRVLKQELRLNLPPSPSLIGGEFVRRSPYNTPRDDPFILSSPRGEVASAYLNKLELVSRCLNHAMDSARDQHCATPSDKQ